MIMVDARSVNFFCVLLLTGVLPMSDVSAQPRVGSNKSGVETASSIFYAPMMHTEKQMPSVRDSEPWKAWSITEDDWKTYTKIMAGPRGHWSPDISPVSVLGIHAQSEIERVKYAEIAAQQDWDRLMTERAWFLTYDIVKERIFSSKLKEIAEGQTSLSQIKSHDRLILFTGNDCNPVCRRILTHILTVGASLDIYFVEATDQQLIGQWAQSNRIPPELVNKTKQFTLNVDIGFFRRVSLEAGLPQLFIRDAAKAQLTEVTL